MLSKAEGNLKGQVAVVTGGSSGIGRATCLALARSGASVVVVGRTDSRVQEVVGQVRQLGAESCALGLALDVRQERDMEEMACQTLARFHRIDILIACAGIGKGDTERLLPYAVAAMPIGEWEEVVGTNLKGVFLSNRAVLPSMIRQRGGTIINISSARGGRFGSPYASAYCASKFGVIGLSESLAEEVREFGIKVHVVLPDVTDTPIWGKGPGPERFGKSLSPSCVADLIIYLLCQPDDVVVPNPLITSAENSFWFRGRG